VIGSNYLIFFSILPDVHWLYAYDYPKWSTVKSFYYRAIAKGIWEKVMQFLVKETRINAGRNENPSYALIDSQSVKTTADANNRGYDGGKKQKDVNVIL
jgi:putative transposase